MRERPPGEPEGRITSSAPGGGSQRRYKPGGGNLDKNIQAVGE